MELNRRHVFKSMGVIGLAAAGSGTQTKAEEPERAQDDTIFYAGKLAAAMRSMHGGEWRLDINHHAKMVVLIQV